VVLPIQWRWFAPLFAVLIGLSCAGAQAWQAAAQPNLAEALAAAPALAGELIESPVKTIQPSATHLVPNPDGQSYDILQFYFRAYGGPNAFIMHDTASGETKQLVTERRPIAYNVHLAPTVLAPNGKLFISTLNGGREQHLLVYDPA